MGSSQSRSQSQRTPLKYTSEHARSSAVLEKPQTHYERIEKCSGDLFMRTTMIHRLRAWRRAKASIEADGPIEGCKNGSSDQCDITNISNSHTIV